jgi:aspartyl-tRNA(Asn)/glutamyl-tRNA(Gln) amidotransferase subunit A
MTAMRRATEAARLIAQGEQSAESVVREALDRMARLDGPLHCFREVCAERALERARSIDRSGRHRGGTSAETPPLLGVPIAVKDNIATAFGTTACGSRMLEGYRSPFSATVIERLETAGAIILGKTNCDEFAMGSSTEHCAYGPTRNPWNPRKVPGGSSGGSAAAVAAGICPGALGSETGGSVRQPAALCGVVGLKPSYGRVSRYGLVAFGSSLDQVGPVAGCIADAALLLRTIAGRDQRDSTTADAPVPDYLARLEEPITDLRIGLPRQYLSESNDPAVNAAVEEAIEVYRAQGAAIVEVDLPLTDLGIATYYILAPAEASSNLARFDGIRYGHRAALREGEDLFDLYARSRAEGFGPEVQRRIMLGTYVLSAGYAEAYYHRALRVRRLIKEEFDRAFQQCHVLLGPTSPFPAFDIGARPDPLSMYLCDVYTVNANIAGICALSLPAGFAAGEAGPLPIGLQLQAQAYDEMTLLRAARMFERATDWHRRHPPPE